MLFQTECYAATQIFLKMRSNITLMTHSWSICVSLCVEILFSTLAPKAAAGLSKRFHNDLLKNDEKFLLKEPIYVTDNWSSVP